MKQESGFQAVISKVVEKHKDKFGLAEKIAIGLAFLGLIMFYTLQMNLMLAIGFLFLATIYFLMALIPMDLDQMQDSTVLDSPGIILFLNKLAYITLSASAMVILFSMVEKNRSDLIFMVVGANLIVVLTYWLGTRKAPNAKALNKVFAFRILLMLVALFTIFLVNYL